MKARFQQWWSSLTLRERRTVGLGAVFVGLSMVIFGDIEPVWRLRANLLADLPQLRQQRLEMQALIDEARQLRGVQVTSAAGDSLETLVSRALAAGGLQAQALKPLERDAIQVTLKAVDASRCLHWLDQMSREARLTIQSARLLRTGGLIDVDVTLRRPARS